MSDPLQELLAPTRAAYVEGRVPALESWLTRSRWEVLVRDCAVDARELSCRISALRDSGVLEYLRGEKKKTIDVSSALVSWECRDAKGGVALTLDTRSSNAGALRPQLLIDHALAGAAAGSVGYDCLKVCRVSQAHEDENSGLLVKPL